MSQLTSDISHGFSDNGPLAKAISGYRARDAQIEMAMALGRAIDEQQQLIVEAQTGTGKSYAYLVTALLSGCKTIISTGTKALQEQLFYKDLPLVRKALGKGVKVALLKGRSNYLCLHRMEQNWQSLKNSHSDRLDDLAVIKRWSMRTDSGDLGDVPGLAENSMALPMVTSSVDNCAGRKCKDYDDCFLLKARRRAMDADLVVVNHHLFFADMALKDTGFGELIPQAELIIFDEAHQLPDIACGYFGQSLSSRQFKELTKDIAYIYHSELKDSRQLLKAAELVERGVDTLRLCFSHQGERGDWRQALRRGPIQTAWQEFNEHLDFLYEVVKISLSRSENLDNCFERLVELKGKLALFANPEQLGFSFWYEAGRQHLQFNLSPLSVADKFREHCQSFKASWLFTSATLQVDNSFGHYQELLGLDKANTLALASPFDYQQQAMFCVPRYLPEPSQPGYVDQLAQLVIETIRASGGGVLILVTSFSTLNRLAELVAPMIDQHLLIQGADSKQNLLADFSADGHGVLLATASFWEGVDVRGDALRCVIIDKLPFAAPDEPLLKARLEDCRRRGIEGFDAVQVPQAVIALKQGAGRLIRDYTDRGAFLVCDSRLISRPYGRVFLQSLPPMARTRDTAKIFDYLRRLNNADEQRESSETSDV